MQRREGEELRLQGGWLGAGDRVGTEARWGMGGGRYSSGRRWIDVGQ